MPVVQTEANRLIDASNGTTAMVAPTTPIKVALTTTVGTATAAGTEVSGGPGPYARQNATFGAAASGSAANNVALNYAGMPAVTVVGVDMYDSAGTPRRTWTGALTASKTTNSGDTFSIAVGQLTVAFT